MSKKQPILFIAILAVTLSVFSGCAQQTQNNQVNNNKDLEKAESGDAKDASSDVDDSEWRTYQNKEYGFEVKYPKNWEYKENKIQLKNDKKLRGDKFITVTFGTRESFPGGHFWSISVLSNPKNIEEITKEIGNQFDKKNKTREKLNINNQKALFVKVTTSELSNWESNNVFIEKDNIVYKISGSNLEKEKFEKFYNSFLLKK